MPSQGPRRELLTVEVGVRVWVQCAGSVLLSTHHTTCSKDSEDSCKLGVLLGARWGDSCCPACCCCWAGPLCKKQTGYQAPRHPSCCNNAYFGLEHAQSLRFPPSDRWAGPFCSKGPRLGPKRLVTSIWFDQMLHPLCIG